MITDRELRLWLETVKGIKETLRLGRTDLAMMELGFLEAVLGCTLTVRALEVTLAQAKAVTAGETGGVH